MALTIVLGACGRSNAPKAADSTSPGASAGTAIPAAATTPPDSLLLRAPAGVEVWATFVREGTDSGGRSCVERAVEVRDGSHRRPVPLLYTRDTPTLVNDTTIRARLWTNCRPGDAYLVNLRNGLPIRKTK